MPNPLGIPDELRTLVPGVAGPRPVSGSACHTYNQCMNILTLVGVLTAAYGGAAWLLRREYAPEVRVGTGSAPGRVSAMSEKLSRS